MNIKHRILILLLALAAASASLTTPSAFAGFSDGADRGVVGESSDPDGFSDGVDRGVVGESSDPDGFSDGADRGVAEAGEPVPDPPPAAGGG